MSNLAVAHLPIWQSNRLTTGDQCCIRVLRIQGGYKWYMGMLDDITLINRTKAPAVHDHEDTFFIFHPAKLLHFNLSSFSISKGINAQKHD